jgi:hypothetical protein
VPFFLRWPGHVPTNATDPRMVGNVDMAPTTIAGVNEVSDPDISPLRPMDGMSLLGAQARGEILTEGWPDTKPPWASILTPTYHYIESYGRDANGNPDYSNIVFHEFYDLTPGHDPQEWTNAYPPTNPTAQTLHDKLADYRVCAGRPPCP